MNRLERFFASLSDEEDYFQQALAFEKLCAENEEYGKDVLGKLNRAYGGCKVEGTLGTVINRESEWWRDAEERDK